MTLFAKKENIEMKYEFLFCTFSIQFFSAFFFISSVYLSLGHPFFLLLRGPDQSVTRFVHRLSDLLLFNASTKL